MAKKVDPSQQDEEGDTPLLIPAAEYALPAGLVNNAAAGSSPQEGTSWGFDLKRLMALSCPLMAQGVLAYTSSLIGLAFVGHMRNEVALSGVVLANSVFNATGWALNQGLASALETICGQAYGSKNFSLMGIALQRALLICYSACLPISWFWANTRPALLAIHQDPDIAEAAHRYMSNLIPTLWAVATMECVRRFLTAQNVVVPGTVITAVTSLFSPIYYYVLIFRLDWGIEGAAHACNLTFITNAVLLVGYTSWRELRLLGSAQQSWPGWNLRALSGWGAYLRLALPATIMFCMEWWLWEAVIFMSGYLPNRKVAVGVMGIGLAITTWVYMFPSSLGVATNTLVANHLGAGHRKQAKRVCWLGLGVGAAISLAFAVLYVVLRYPITRMMATSEDTIQLSLKMAHILAMTFLGDGINSIMFGILRASGRQSWGAIMTTLTYWAFGFPLGIYLAFNLKWNVFGLWGAITVASLLQASICGTIILHFNWQLEVDRAAALVGQHTSESLAAPLLVDTDLEADEFDAEPTPTLPISVPHYRSPGYVAPGNANGLRVGSR